MEQEKNTNGDCAGTKVYELVEKLAKYLPEEVQKYFND